MPNLTFVPACDLYDTYLDQAKVPKSLQWRSFGKEKRFCGYAITVKCFEDNSRVKELVEQPQSNPHVLIVDGGGSYRCALLGDQLAAAAEKNQWAGIVVHGCVRDVDILSTIPIGIVALGCTPRKSKRMGEGQVNVPIFVGDVVVHPGDAVFVDSDGVLFLDPSILKLQD